MLCPSEHHRSAAGERKDPSKARLRGTGASGLVRPAHGGGAHLRLVGRSLRRRDPPGLVPPVRSGQEHAHVRPRRGRTQRADRRVLRATKGTRGSSRRHRPDAVAEGVINATRWPRQSSPRPRFPPHRGSQDCSRALSEGASIDKPVTFSPLVGSPQKVGLRGVKSGPVTPAWFTTSRFTHFGEPDGGLR